MPKLIAYFESCMHSFVYSVITIMHIIYYTQYTVEVTNLKLWRVDVDVVLMKFKP